jgi:hypothetical protein
MDRSGRSLPTLTLTVRTEGSPDGSRTEGDRARIYERMTAKGKRYEAI